MKHRNTSTLAGKLTLLLTLTLLCGAMRAQDQWVITYTDGSTTHFMSFDGTCGQSPLAGNETSNEYGYLSAATDFDPNTCIWVGNSGGKFQWKNTTSGKFLRWNSDGSGYIYATNIPANGNVWVVQSSGNRYIYSYPSWSTSSHFYIKYGNGQWNRLESYNGVTFSNASAYKVTVTQSNPISIRGAEFIDAPGSHQYRADFTQTTTYNWTIGSKTITTGNVSATPTWSVSSNSYASINANTGVLTVNSLPSSATTIQVTATATVNGSSQTLSLPVVLYPASHANAVTLDDREPHSWTYYQPEASGGVAGLSSPNPKDVKITYKAGAVGTSAAAISKTEAHNQIVYHKTLEASGNKYPYTTIPNPYSKRPRTGSGSTVTATQTGNGSKVYYGFDGWIITKLANGTIKRGSKTYAEGDTIHAETQVNFLPTGEYNMEVEFCAMWREATVIFCTATELPTYIANAAFAGKSYERNFLVIYNGSKQGSAEHFANGAYPVTVTMIEPDGSKDYRSSSRWLGQDYYLANDMKFEWINMGAVNSDWNIWLTAEGHDLVLGRGISHPTNANTVSAQYIRGLYSEVGTDSEDNCYYKIRIESGRYTHVAFVRGVSGCDGGGTYREFKYKDVCVTGTLGCDYDRATGDNNKLYVTHQVNMGRYCGYRETNQKTDSFKLTVKSGQINSSMAVEDADAGEAIYLSCSYTDNGHGYTGRRYLTVEGGLLKSIAGGYDPDNSNEETNATIRIKGGTIKGSVYGSAQYAKAMGNRKLVITGGTIEGWVAGGCNGTDEPNNSTNSYGITDGNTYVYIGGNVHIGGNTNVISHSVGGNVFGAGSGYSEDYVNIGKVNNSNVVIADNAEIEGDVYGGGNFGYTDKAARVYMRGGSVQGSVFGGANRNNGCNFILSMTGGTVLGGIYGGSNEKGNMSQYCQINVLGGTVGSASAPARICGGGLGSPTRVYQDIAINIGQTGTDGPTIYADIYGGSALGLVNTNGNDSATLAVLGCQTDRHTYVEMQSGTVTGNIYGGGLGNSRYTANVYGETRTRIFGGTVNGSVFGCNNVNGRPFDTSVIVCVGNNGQGVVTGDVYGGGNQASYTGNPDVLIWSGGKVEGNVYGGGLGSTATVSGSPSVSVKGSGTKVDGNVYGGGNGAEVTGNSTVNIGE